MKFLRDNGVGVFFGLLFLGALGGQAFAGYADLVQRRLADGGAEPGFFRYLASSEFAVDVAENWQSEYLQFFLYIIATVWLIQRGSPESKPPRDIGLESDQKQQVGSHAGPEAPKWAHAGGWRTRVFSNSLGLVMGGIFLLSWLVQSVAGVSAYNADQLAMLEDPVPWAEYLGTADFWNRSLQNWQSEFLAIGSMAVFSVYLRQRGSPESKPVGAAHSTTDEAG
ncbi:hypothetical protein NLX83_36265 [Allokutzneria sp. A3M-2-11 16]|uniref:DUF6766 family protein n=1 Tax=Allokutzneria sp. A3M-2-11 16 TaxID=2962043 RepID=UPI0020B6ED75|nr:DUF6766 family protein [Allokutzneria sp. A3M-2-11 16]MCP3804735.1 hypothetical protein [Allokutzneria sp. A3M-2-11 16]